MSIDSSFNEPLEKLTNAVNEKKISPSKPYKRHFIIHSIDFLQILNTIFNNNNNNNINNNNNNNVDINYNTINQDSNDVISNSENMNMVMAMILPVPGKRTLNLFNRWESFSSSAN